jgi:hypothetical protein
VQCTATANDGLAASADDQAQILYGFSGFLAPINNPPTVNTGKAGKTYPVKWQLKDTSGAFVGTLAAVRSIKYKAVSCTSLSSSTDPIETAASGGSALRYDSTANQYVYNWQTPSAPGCYELDVALNDDTTQVADFKLS